MRDLVPVGLTEDGTRLVLVSDSGEEFAVTATALTDALEPAPPQTRPAQLENQMDTAEKGGAGTSALRPRDIQARIRAGESPETVAAVAQTSVDKIMVFAMPVLAERAHVAERAQRASVRRRAADSSGGLPGGLLGDAVNARLRSQGVDLGTVSWDAWRRDDGRWALVADYAGDGHAEFVYDAAGRYVVADDDTARWLVGERGDGTVGTERRLSAVPNEELPLGADAIEMVRDDESTADLTETARAVRAVPAPPVAPDLIDTPDADWIITQATDRLAQDSQRRTPQGSVPEAREPADEPIRQTAPASEAETEAEQQGRGRKGRRASVPSWDEIMFGSGKAE